ncbi:MAG TPA: DUF6174 domain-containing protein [Polyangia bacterium]|jgi:hypothetical protein|nr:DUF6174 domain-containing protein [Polyangia bacterium]
MLQRKLVAFVGVLALSLASVGCSAGGGATVAEQRALWARRNIVNYRFQLRQLCFCPDSGKPFEIRVQDGVVVEVKNGTTGEMLDPSRFTYYPTIEGLFDKLQDAVERNAYQLQVTYDSTYGFPASASIDYDKRAVDEEYGFEVSAFTPLP